MGPGYAVEAIADWTLAAAFAAIALSLAAGMAGAASLPERTVAATLGIQTKTGTCSSADLEAIGKLGARFIRRGFYWSEVEKEKGTYDFGEYDRLLDDADAHGLRVLGCLFSHNDHHGKVWTERGRKGFAAFAAAAASRYRGRNVLWEVWNEPNVRSFWRKDGTHNSEEFAEEYTALVKEVLPAMLAADPECFVMAGSVSNYWEPAYRWTEHCFRKGMLATGIRAWSVHPYGVRSPEEHAAGHARMRELMRKHNAGAEIPLVTSERGFSVEKTGEGWSGGFEAKAMEHQAWHFVRQHLIDRMCDVRLTVWYEWSGREFGVVHGGLRRPVAKACGTMARALEGCSFEERIETGSALDYVLAFRDAAGARRLVAWTSPPPGRPPDEAIEHPVAIPVGRAGKFVVTDLYGSEREATATGGVLVLALGGAPQYIRTAEPTR